MSQKKLVDYSSVFIQRLGAKKLFGSENLVFWIRVIHSFNALCKAALASKRVESSVGKGQSFGSTRKDGCASKLRDAYVSP